MARRKRSRPLVRLAVVALLLASGWMAFEAARWPDVAALADTFPRSTAFIDLWKDRERAAGRRGDPDWRVVPYARISPHLKRAVLVGEDVNFFSHHGFEVAEMKNALREAWDDRDLPRGASTITQQLAKNLWLSPSRNPLRKVKEAILTRQLESSLSKRRIFELYLNVVEFGPGIYGAEAAARRYFGKSASELGEEEAAALAAALPNPDGWNPSRGSRTAASRREKLLRRMARAEFLWREI
jgi:monofunctional biosynthetic peptidoglycan transglycosylase